MTFKSEQDLEISKDRPAINLNGTEGSAENLSIRENGGAIELYNEGSGAVAATWDLNPILERASIEDERKTATTSVSYTTSGDEVVLADSSGGAITVTLASADVAAGKVIYVKDYGGSAGTNAITIATGGSETIDGATSISVSTNYGKAAVVSDGTNWFVLE